MRLILSVTFFLCVLSVPLLAAVPANVSRAIEMSLIDMRDAEKEWAARQQLQTLCDTLGTPDLDAKREEAEQMLIAALNDRKNEKAQTWIVRMLGRLGTGDCATAIAVFLQSKNETLFDETIATLARIPGSRTREVLQNAFSQTDDTKKKMAILSAFGYRAEPENAAFLQEYITELDKEIAVESLKEARWDIPPELLNAYAQTPEKIQFEQKKKIYAAAITAFGQIETEDVREHLLLLRLSAFETTKMVFGPSLVDHAARILRKGKEADALAMYQPLQFSTDLPGVRCAGMNGMLRVASSPDDIQFLLFYLGRAEQDRTVWDVAFGFLWDFDGKIGRLIGPARNDEDTEGQEDEEDTESKKIYKEQEQIERFKKLPLGIQAALLEILGEKRDDTAITLVRYGMKSENPMLSTAAYGALAGVGIVDENQENDSITILLKKLAEETKLPEPGITERTIVRGLSRTLLENADAKIAAEISNAKEIRFKKTLLEIATARRVYLYLPTFFQAIGDDDPAVRDIAVQGYGKIAKLEDVGALLNAILKTSKREKRIALERAALKICERNPNKTERAAPILEFYTKSDENKHDALLGLLGKIGGPQAFEIVLKTMRDGSPTAKAEAFQSLCSWPDTHAMDELYRLSTKLVNKQLADEAFRGYLRILTLPSERTAEETVALFEKSKQRANTSELQNELLRRIATVRTLKTLDFVVPFMENPETQETAFRAILELAKDDSFHAANRTKIDPLLENILRNAKSSDPSERARTLLDK